MNIRNMSTPEGRRIWEMVEKAASRAPQWIKDQIQEDRMGIPTPKYCPICGVQSFINKGDKTEENGGQIFVAEELDDSIECYDIINIWECGKGHHFYLSIEQDRKGS